MKQEKFTAWITKYALTVGVYAAKVENLSGGMIRYECNHGMSYMYVHGEDWHRTPEAAIARAEEMRSAKIKALHKKLAELERMDFATQANKPPRESNDHTI